VALGASFGGLGQSQKDEDIVVAIERLGCGSKSPQLADLATN
jgi:hypothetical protein